MTPYYSDGMVTLYHGDAFEIIPTLASATVAAVVTDPPFGYSVAHNSGNYYTVRPAGNTWSDADVMGRWFATLLDVLGAALQPSWSLL